MAKNSEEGIFINDIVKEYPNMFKIIIYHDGYYLPSSDRKEIKKVNKETTGGNLVNKIKNNDVRILSIEVSGEQKQPLKI